MDISRQDPDTVRNSETSSAEQLEIDRVLRRRRLSQVKSCYPCRQRKVRCDHGQPCQTCQKRGHPEICAYGIDAPDMRRVRRAKKELVPSRQTRRTQESSPDRPPLQANVSQSRPVSDQNVELAPPAQIYCEIFNQGEPAAERFQSSSSSVLAVLDRVSQESPGQMRREAVPVLGLSNTLDMSPFAKPKTAQELWAALLKIVPQQEELQMYFPSHGSPIYPLSPIFADLASLEAEMCNYAQALAGGDLQNHKIISSHWITKESLSKVALLLAALATGAHFSAIQSPRNRLELCLDFGMAFASLERLNHIAFEVLRYANVRSLLVQRAFEALRLANFALHPNLDNVHALLIIGNTLQDCGQSDGSWVLLGTTIRLAQALGLHLQTSSPNPGNVGDQRSRALWDLLARQDCLLSITLGRSAMVLIKWLSDTPASYSAQLNPGDVMRNISRIALKIMNSDQQLNRDECIKLLSELDDCDSRSQLHLQRRDKCVNLQQHFEHLTIRLHLSFVASILCRPVLTDPSRLCEDTQSRVLRDRAKQSLMETSRIFLDFHALSVIPMRTWSITHSVLCSTLLLCAWGETRDSPEVRTLQQRVVEAFSRAAKRGETGNERDHRDPCKNTWLTTGHILALVALRKTLHSSTFAPPLSGPAIQQSQSPTQQQQYPDLLYPEADLTDFDFNFTTLLDEGFRGQTEEWPLEQDSLPPLEYLDAVMNTTGRG